jgi:prophage maintenance system killer protein
MTLSKWRTTKIPAYWFHEIERTIAVSHQFVSVSEFIRTAVEEKLSSTSKDFLLIKDFIFTEAMILHIHQRIATRFGVESKGLLKRNLQDVITQSLDMDLVQFLSKFMGNFARHHLFKDGNKRTLLVAIDSFLRLNNLKLRLEARRETETDDEKFFWQNSNQQKTLEQIREFISTRLVSYASTHTVDTEIEQSMDENALLLEKLAR